MRPDLLLVALLLLSTSRADRSTNWWRDSDSSTRRGNAPGRLSSFQAAPQQPDGLELLPQVVGETFQSKVSQFSRTPASTQVISIQNNSTIKSHPDPVSSHILDTTLGKPAAGVVLTFSRQEGGSNGSRWTEISSRTTNQDGRASAFLSWEEFADP